MSQTWQLADALPTSRPSVQMLISHGVMIQRSEETRDRSITLRIAGLFCMAETIAVAVPDGWTPSSWLNSPPQLPAVRSMSVRGNAEPVTGALDRPLRVRLSGLVTQRGVSQVADGAHHRRRTEPRSLRR